MWWKLAWASSEIFIAAHTRYVDTIIRYYAWSSIRDRLLWDFRGDCCRKKNVDSSIGRTKTIPDCCGKSFHDTINTNIGCVRTAVVAGGIHTTAVLTINIHIYSTLFLLIDALNRPLLVHFWPVCMGPHKKNVTTLYFVRVLVAVFTPLLGSIVTKTHHADINLYLVPGMFQIFYISIFGPDIYAPPYY